MLLIKHTSVVVVVPSGTTADTLMPSYSTFLGHGRTCASWCVELQLSNSVKTTNCEYNPVILRCWVVQLASPHYASVQDRT